MKIYSKKIVSLVVIFALLLSLCVTTFFASETAVVNGSVCNTDSADDTVSVSQIQLDVYALIPVFIDSNQTDYDKEFAFSLYTDLSGEFSFTKPSANCIVEINENTVADGYGVLIGIDIIGADETTAELSISPLATYEIDLENNSIQFYNAQDEALTVKENFNYESASLHDLELKVNDISMGDGLIDTYASSYRPTVPNVTTYTEGDFTLYYESGRLTYSELRRIYNQLNFTKTALCYTYQFRTPNFVSGSSTYEVYLVDGLKSGTEHVAGVIYGNMYDWFIGIDISSGLTDYAMHAISHEFMHAVQLAYTYRTGNEFKAFNEGVAELAGYVCYDYLYSPWINQFQDSPELSLLDNGTEGDPYYTTGPYKNREYGSVLFSLYLYENYSGLTTIRQIYEEYAETNDIYLSLDNTLKEYYNTTLIEAYLDFRVAVYDPHSNYETELPSGLNSPKKTAITEDVITYTTPKLSTMYFEFEAATEDYYTFYFALQGETEVSEVNLTGIYTSPDGEVTIIDYPFTSSLKMPNVDMEEGSTICFLMSNINTTDTDIQFYACM